MQELVETRILSDERCRTWIKYLYIEDEKFNNSVTRLIGMMSHVCPTMMVFVIFLNMEKFVYKKIQPVPYKLLDGPERRFVREEFLLVNGGVELPPESVLR
ncbi:hypothetical protein RCL_jg9336.t1 [Rhizophagus clarus]|uniref:Uncharacterized protein n=1 Tax=Rhizophagus clarus TaxID=94130 RepID=A0A8H3MA55_9GLOM|nr:hypothetical protein RCL_jg9336.t1 [Rhizophagus clarus]